MSNVFDNQQYRSDLLVLERVTHDAKRWKAFTNMARHNKSDRARMVKIIEDYHRLKQRIEQKGGV